MLENFLVNVLIGIRTGIRTRDLRDTGAMLYQLSYEATHPQPQFKYELFHIYFTSFHFLRKI